MKKIFGIILAMSLLNSCMIYNEIQTEPWEKTICLGHTYEEIIRAKGTPNRIIPNGTDGQILIYETYRSEGDTYYNGYGYASTTMEQKRDYVEVYMNGTGKCYDVKTNVVHKDIRWGATILANTAYVGTLLLICYLCGL